jgi:hypothetical protein
MKSNIILDAIRHVGQSLTKRDKVYFSVFFSLFALMFIAQEGVAIYSGRLTPLSTLQWQAASIVFLFVWLSLLLTLTALGKQLRNNQNT